MSPPSRIVLAGFMGTGKSEVGRRLARALGWRFVDTDALVESGAGRSVGEIFATDGEPAFRERERAAVAEACALHAVVIAVGGGALLDAENRRALLAAGPVVCLRASPREILRRVGAARERPLLWGGGGLSGADRLARIEAMLAERAPVYACATHTVDTDGLTPARVAARIRALTFEAPDGAA